MSTDNYTNARAFVRAYNSKGEEHFLLVLEYDKDKNKARTNKLVLSIPGGKKEIADISSKHTATRELIEETSNNGASIFAQENALQYGGNKEIDIGRVHRIPTVVEYFHYTSVIHELFYEISNGEGSVAFCFVPRTIILNAIQHGKKRILVNGKYYQIRGPTIATYNIMFGMFLL